MTTSDEPPIESPVKPDFRFMLSHPAHMLSLGFGSGLARKAPGTFGTLVAFPIYWYLSQHLTDAQFIFVLIWAYAVGVWVCGITGEALGESDHGGIVWDEIVAFVLVLFFTPPGWEWSLLAFTLFRFFDIIKPQPIQYFDTNLKGGHGVMFDDLLAAGYALLCLAIIKSVLLSGGA